MSRHVGTGLARVTIAAPNRRIDVALPEHVAPAELLPALLRHAGDDLADAGQQHGGWILRRADGTPLDAGRPLGAQSVLDGEVLHLVPRRTEWPELDYDDVVDAIAAGARRQGQAWTGAATRTCGLAAGAVVLVLGLLAILRSGPSWLVPGLVALGVALALTVAGAVLSRGLSDSVAGAVLAAVALPYAFAGGALVAGGDREIGDFGAPHLLAGSAVLLVVSLIAYLAVADRTQVFVAGATAGLLGGGGALAAFMGAEGAGATAVVVSVALAMVPALPLLAIRMGKLPMPALPANAEELVKAEPLPPRSKVYASVVRSDELLTGMLGGASLVLAVGQVLLVTSGSVAGAVLVAIVAAAALLRARSFPTIRLRVPLLVAGIVGLTALVLGPTFGSTTVRLAVLVPLLAVAAAYVVFAGLTYSRRSPTPYLGRIADVLDVTLVIAVVPVACGVLGLYGYVRGIAG